MTARSYSGTGRQRLSLDLAALALAAAPGACFVMMQWPWRCEEFVIGMIKMNIV